MTSYQSGLYSARKVAIMKAWELRKSAQASWSSQLSKEQFQKAMACRTLAEIYRRMIKA